MTHDIGGPLVGLRVLEFAGPAPAPHAALVLADLGADVVRLTRAAEADDAASYLLRGRQSVTADLRGEDDRSMALGLVERADVLIEGYRPGVMERLGLGPDECLSRNPRLVYTRITGWGQSGPLARRAGHDINYVGLTGVLNAIGHVGERPVPPLNLLGDFGGGSMLALVGILSALWERTRSGRGQVVDAAMVDGVSLLAEMLWEFRARGELSGERGTNALDSGAPFYDTYRCADGRYVAVGALEPRFYAELVRGLGLNAAELPDQRDRDGWPVLRARIAEAFGSRTRSEWEDVFRDVDACVTPVLAFAEVAAHPHIAERSTILGTAQAAPAPRFSRSTVPIPAEPTHVEPQVVVARWETTNG